MADYKSYSSGELDKMYKFVCMAYASFDCPDYVPCNECCIVHDCKALKHIRDNLFEELRKRKAKNQGRVPNE